MSEFEKLKQITIKMKHLAEKEIDTNFKDSDEADKQCILYSLFQHGAKSQKLFLSEVMEIDVDSLDVELIKE